MPRLECYDWEVGSGKHLPIHSEWSPVDDTLYIRRNDPKISSKVGIAHELGHIKGYGRSDSTSVGGEIVAWENAIRGLVKSGGWDAESKGQVIWALTSYMELRYPSDEAEKEARDWVNRMESRARRELRG